MDAKFKGFAAETAALSLQIALAFSSRCSSWLRLDYDPLSRLDWINSL